MPRWPNPFTAEELAYVAEHRHEPNKLIAKALGRKLSQVRSVKKRKGIGRPDFFKRLDPVRVRALYDAGQIDRVIAEAVGVTPCVVLRWRRKNDLPANGTPAATAARRRMREGQFAELYARGWNDGQIGKACGCSGQVVIRWRRDSGIPANPLHEDVIAARSVTLRKVLTRKRSVSRGNVKPYQMTPAELEVHNAAKELDRLRRTWDEREAAARKVGRTAFAFKG